MTPGRDSGTRPRRGPLSALLSRLRDDRGSISPVLPVMALIILLLGGLVIDAGRQLDLRARAIAYAQEAARAGASQIDPRRTELVLMPDQVAEQVNGYCDEIEGRGVVESCEYLGISEDPDDGNLPLIVSVQVEMKTNASLLSMVGVRELHASGQGQARPFQGVREIDDQPDTGQQPDDGASDAGAGAGSDAASDAGADAGSGASSDAGGDAATGADGGAGTDGGAGAWSGADGGAEAEAAAG